MIWAQTGNLVHLRKGGGELGFGIVRGALFKGGKNIAAGQAANGDDERVAECSAIARVQHLKAGKFIRAAGIKAGPGLFGAGFGCQVPGNGQFTGKFGMRAQQRRLRIMAGSIDNARHTRGEVGQLVILHITALCE